MILCASVSQYILIIFRKDGSKGNGGFGAGYQGHLATNQSKIILSTYYSFCWEQINCWIIVTNLWSWYFIWKGMNVITGLLYSFLSIKALNMNIGTLNTYGVKDIELPPSSQITSLKTAARHSLFLSYSLQKDFGSPFWASDVTLQGIKHTLYPYLIHLFQRIP